MPKSWWEKKRKEDEHTLKELNSAAHRSQAKCRLVQTSYIKHIKLFLSLPYNKHLINRAKSVCMGESWPRSCVQTSLRSVCTQILPHRPPARLIRAKYRPIRLLETMFSSEIILKCNKQYHMKVLKSFHMIAKKYPFIFWLTVRIS